MVHNDFETTFDRQYITDMMHDLKGQELMNLELGNMSVIEYEVRFVWIASFVVDLHLPNNIMAKIVEEHLTPHIRIEFLCID